MFDLWSYYLTVLFTYHVLSKGPFLVKSTNLIILSGGRLAFRSPKISLILYFSVKVFPMNMFYNDEYVLFSNNKCVIFQTRRAPSRVFSKEFKLFGNTKGIISDNPLVTSILREKNVHRYTKAINNKWTI